MNVLVANIFKMFRQEEPEVDFKKFINSFNSLGSKFNFSGGKLGFLLLTGILLMLYGFLVVCIPFNLQSKLL